MAVRRCDLCLFLWLIECVVFLSRDQVAYMPGMPMDHLEQEVALQRERQIRFHAVQTDMELNLPPAIRISKDGEEGYVHSQRLLQLSWTADRRRESICPPPNKTVYQGDSPPPYRSNSVGKVEGHSLTGKKSLLANKLGCNGNGSPRISHCPSLTAEKRAYCCTAPSSHGKLTPCTPTAVPTAVPSQSCCHQHHACHGSHGSQLPTSHLSQSLHSYGSAQPAGVGGSGAASPVPSGASAIKSRLCPSRNSSPALQRGIQAGSHHAALVQCSKNNNNSEHRRYYGPPPDYSELAPPATPPTSTLQQQQQQQKVQSDSHV